MNEKIVNDQSIKNSLTEAKTIAMVGVSSVKKRSDLILLEDLQLLL